MPKSCCTLTQLRACTLSGEPANGHIKLLAFALLCLVVIVTALYFFLIWEPSDSSTSNITCGTNWTRKGVHVAGRRRSGSALTQLNSPEGLYVDDNGTVLIADSLNDRIVEWELGAQTGRMVADGKKRGNRTDQLNSPSAVIIDRKTDTFIICDTGRVVRWPRRNGSNGITIIENIDCAGLAMDNEGSIYIADNRKHQVRRYPKGESNGIVVAGGDEPGDRLRQLNRPLSIFVDRDHSVYVSDGLNNRVMKWVKGATEGVVVAGGNGDGNGLTQLSYPTGVLVDAIGTVYVADSRNHRVMRWCRKATQGTVSAGGYGPGRRPGQLMYPSGLAFDRRGNLYVSDSANNRVQKFLVSTG